MGAKLDARRLHHLASTDQFDGVGRIFLAEAKQALHKPDLTIEDITELWQEYYPTETADALQSKIVLVFFDGKAVTQNVRAATPTIQPAAAKGTSADNWTHFKARKPPQYQKDADVENPEDHIIAASIIEDDEGAVDEEEDFEEWVFWEANYAILCLFAEYVYVLYVYMDSFHSKKIKTKKKKYGGRVNEASTYNN